MSASELEQGRVIDKPEKHDEPSGDEQPKGPSRWERLLRGVRSLQFTQRVRVYLVVLLLGALAYIGLLARLWLPDLID